MNLQEDEVNYLGTRRCDTCGHLSSLHNTHCCVFCMVDGCNCEWDWQD